jgi:hypothetical protein
MPMSGFWKAKKLELEGGQLLELAVPFLLSFFLPLAGAGVLLHWVVAAATVGSWPPQHPRRSQL